jgi:DNA polymerase-3 subunit alpha
MLRLRRVVSWNWFEENYTKEQLDVPAGYFEFKIRIQEIALIGLKHINLKEASDAIRQQFGENKRLRFLKQSFQKIKKYWLIQTLYIYITTHNSPFYNRQ